jgi:hypothetical protein
MGRTFKDKHKWERKQRDKEVEGKSGKRPNKKRYEQEQIVPDDDPLDPYELYDYEDYN